MEENTMRDKYFGIKTVENEDAGDANCSECFSKGFEKKKL